MTRRAIVVVPGMSKNARGECRSRLARSLMYYANEWKCQRGNQDDDDGALCFTFNHRCEKDSIDIDIYEAYWGDVVVEADKETPLLRLKRGKNLIYYWLVTGFFNIAVLRNELPARAIFSLSIGGLFLLIWYLYVICVFVSATFPSADIFKTISEYIVSSIEKKWGDDESITEAVEASILIVMSFGIFLLSYLEYLSNISTFVMSYLRDDPVGDQKLGLRALLRQRVVSVLDVVTAKKDDQRYDEIYVLGHSLGGVIAVDALADYGTDSSRITLVTWGSALGFLAQVEPKIEVKIGKLYSAKPRLRNWVDVVFKSDLMGSKAPIPRKDPEGRGSRRYDQLFLPTVELTRPQGLPFWTLARLHDYYFYNEKAASLLVCPEAQLSARVRSTIV